MTAEPLLSVSFDHAADAYDATRALPAAVQEAYASAVLAGLTSGGAGRVLEVGVGTGRIARPLTERGLRVTGVDIAPRMLAKLREQLGPDAVPPDLVLGDATALPFADASFPSALIVHVLHLVSSVPDALRELRRVLASGGVVVHDCTDHGGENPLREIYVHWRSLLDERGFTRRSRPTTEELREAFRSLGATHRVVPVAEHAEQTTPAGLLDRIGRRVDSWSWDVPEPLFSECRTETERWAARHFGDLDRPLPEPISYQIEVWTFP